MKIDIGRSSFNLPREGVVTLRQATGARVVCLNGALWLTQEGREEDIVLQAGESTGIVNGGLTLVTALRPSEVLVTEACTPGRELLRRMREWFSTPFSHRLPSM